MRALKGEVILFEGKIESQEMQNEGNKAILNFKEDGDVTFHFVNKKNDYAKQVKMLRLKNGERVIVKGGIRNGSPNHASGWEICRTGKITQGNMSIIRGSVEDIVPAGSYNLVFLKYEGDEKATVAVSQNKPIKVGDYITCICYSQGKSLCSMNECECFTASKCLKCLGKNSNSDEKGIWRVTPFATQVTIG